MKKFPIVLLLAAALFSSCDKSNDTVKKDTGRRIIPVVSAPAKFKSSDQAEAIETRVIKAGDYDLVETVYDWDDAPGIVNTKAVDIVDGDNIRDFKMNQYWNDGRGAIFSGADVTGSNASGWTLGVSGENGNWRTVPTTFWSYRGVDGVSVDSQNVSQLEVADINDTKDIIIAYNNESPRDHEASHSDELNISFKHALSLVEFNAGGFNFEGYKVTKIEIFTVNGSDEEVPCIYKSSNLTVSGNPLTFNHSTDGKDAQAVLISSIELTSESTTCSFFAIPQSFDNAIIRWTIKPIIDNNVTYPAGTDPSAISITRSAKLNINWVAGKKYTYKLGLKEYYVKFQNNSVTKTTDFGYETSFNNKGRRKNEAKHRIFYNPDTVGYTWDGCPGSSGSNAIGVGDNETMLVDCYLSANNKIQNISRIRIQTGTGTNSATTKLNFITGTIQRTDKNQNNSYDTWTDNYALIPGWKSFEITDKGAGAYTCWCLSRSESIDTSNKLHLEQTKVKNKGWYDYDSVIIYYFNNDTWENSLKDLN